jgi:aminopeptidase
MQRLAELGVGYGVDLKPGQDVLLVASTDNLELARVIGRECYKRGARFVDTLFGDTELKRARIEHGTAESIAHTPPVQGERYLHIGREHGARISVQPHYPPAAMAGLDPKLAGLDQWPATDALHEVINMRTTNWCVMPGPTRAWAAAVFPDLEADEAFEQLWERIAWVCRLDADDPAAAWRERMDHLESVGRRLTERQLDSLHFEGPGTDLTVGLFRSSLWEPARNSTVDGHVYQANIPSEELTSTPDPERTHGVVSATKPLELAGTLIEGLVVRFENGRAVQIDADRGAEALRSRAERDDGAPKLGEVALVDREGRIGQTGTVFYNTLLDENAASHLALGSAYDELVGDEEDRRRANDSTIHIDFMIGSDDVSVTGITPDGERVPVLRGGTWQI